MGGSAPSAPTLDTAASQRLTRADYELKEQFVPRLAAAAGSASLDQYQKNLRFGLGLLTNPSGTIYGDQIRSANKNVQDATQSLGALRAGLKQGKMFDQVSSALGDNQKLLAPRNLTADERRRIQSRITQLERQVQAGKATVGRLQSTNVDQQIRRALPQEYAQRDALMREMGSALGSTEEYGRLQGQLAEGGELGRRLMNEALQRSERGFGQLSAQDEREATQAARSAMAARGLATGNAGIGAELLNRDRYSRQRAAEDINFVGGVMNDQTNRFATSAQLADQERARQLGTRQNMYNFSLQTNPRLLAMGLGSPYANMTQPSMALMGGQNVQAQYSGGQFSGGGFNAGGAAMGALGGAATGAMIGSVVPGIGTAVGAIGGGLIGGLGGGLGGGLSDKREKTDIKKIDGPTNVIGIPAYEYRYKGERKKRKGVMAQDVQKVLPEAVAEIGYKGKKRLAIKPAIIGAALAEQLAADTKPVALAS
jgi:hypothetical protein